MILKALYDYYHRSEGLPEFGYEIIEIGYLLVIDANGKFLNIESRMIDNKTASQFVVLKDIGRTSNIVPNYFWDKFEYILGDDGSRNKKQEAFISMVNEMSLRLPNNKYAKAISQFYAIDQIDIIKKDCLYNELKRAQTQISFLIRGEDHIAAVDDEICRTILDRENDYTIGRCMITGCVGQIARLHTSVTVCANRAPIVSFQEDKGYDSYDKRQGENAPVSIEAEFAYTTALKHLLAKSSPHKFKINNRVFVFWSSSNSQASKAAEESLFAFLGKADEDTDDPDTGISQVIKVFKSIYSGFLNTQQDDVFYILGLAPAGTGRNAVTYWSETPLKDFAARILAHFDDMEICDTRKDKKPYAGVREMISAVALEGKTSNASPNLPEAVVKSVFEGIGYPATLYSASIRRIRAEQNLTIARVAIIKAYLNRLKDNNNRKIEVMLDKENCNVGYLSGRLFAVLVKIQEDANGISSIRERYMNAASATPSTVFGTLLNLSAHHAEKLHDGRQIFFEKLKQEIISLIPSEGFPAHLDLQDQGRFFIGYYHQRQDFFTKNEQ